MSSWLAAFAVAFGAVFLLELPDKTTALTLVLTTRFRAVPMLAGAAVAFALQASIAVALGSAITLLPEQVVAAAVALVFGVGAVLLLRESFARQETDDADAAGAARSSVTFARAALMSFGTLFLAEWGDASQLAALGVAAKYSQPLAVALGAFLALMSVTLLALFVGRKLRNHIPAHLIQRGAGLVFAAFAAVALWQFVSG